jgi:hypothetical protein
VEENAEFQPVPSDELARLNAERKRKYAKQKSVGKVGDYLADRAHLRDAKVTQRQLVYATGILPKFASEELLKGEQFFGQFGKIIKLAISRRPPATSGGKTGENQIAVHVTYASHRDAFRAVQYIENSICEGRTLHATFGTTKYCNTWLMGRNCPVPGCLYLHDFSENSDSISPSTIHR